MFPPLPIRAEANKTLRLLQSHLTRVWMLIVSIPIADKSQMLVFVRGYFYQWKRGFRYKGVCVCMLEYLRERLPCVHGRPLADQSRATGRLHSPASRVPSAPWSPPPPADHRRESVESVFSLNSANNVNNNPPWNSINSLGVVVRTN